MTNFNPLFDVVDSSEQKKDTNPTQGNSLEANASGMESTSLSIDSSDQCPKCKQDMITTSIENSEEVYFCQSCRVALPFPID